MIEILTHKGKDSKLFNLSTEKYIIGFNMKVQK